MIPGISDQARLLRGFATDFLTAHDVSRVPGIMDPAYELSISGHQFSGRDDDYLPATRAQLEQFPGLVVTVHDTLVCRDAVALRFTEHGVSLRNPGLAASWGGISLFEIENGRLRRGWAEEDYFARKAQLASGVFNPVEPPAGAPWDGPCHDPDPETERLVREWLATPAFLDTPGIAEIGVGAPGFREIIDVSEVHLDKLFAGGGRAAFHVRLSGTYRGGFEGTTDIGAALTLPVAGLVTVIDGAVREGHLCADRLGASRAVTKREGR